MALDSILPLVAVGSLLAVIGQGIQPTIPEHWQVWHQTRWLHPVIGGALIGLCARSLPVPDAMGSGIAGRALWYALAGILAVPLYEGAQAWIRRRAER